jgi:tetratricopeptide (TPR) repeat protein
MRNLLLLILIYSIGCATSGSQLATKDPQEAGKNFTVEAVNISAANLLREGNRRCPNTVKEIEKSTWREHVDFAATCAAKEKWTNVEFVGQHMADRFPTAPWGFYFMSLSADARGDMARAFWMLEQASEKDKSLALFPYQRGRIYLKNNETEMAVNEFEKALRLDASLHEADLFLGQIRLRGGNYNGAEKNFRNVLKVMPFHREALMGTARCMIANGDSKMAVDFFDRAIAKDKRDYEARYERAVVIETVFQRFEEALMEYHSLVAVSENKLQIQRRIQDLEKILKTRKIAGGK